jgi:hypothetical protein
MKLNIGLLIAFTGLPLISLAESDDARITKLEEDVKKLQGANEEMQKKLNERPVPIIRRRETTTASNQPLKRAAVSIGETLTLKIDAKENCASVTEGWCRPLISEIPHGTYLVSLKSQMDYSNGYLPIQKIAFWIATPNKPKEYFWAISDGEEIKVEVKDEMLVYAFLVDTVTYDNRGFAELSFKRIE